MYMQMTAMVSSLIGGASILMSVQLSAEYRRGRLECVSCMHPFV